MEISNTGKPPNTMFSFRYNANNEELEELSQACDDDPPTPQSDPPPASDSASPKKTEKSASILDKYFKSMRTEKQLEKFEDTKVDTKQSEECQSPTPSREITSSPMKDYLNRLGKRSTPEVIPDTKETNETWKIFHDFKYKIAQAVEDIKTRSVEESKERLPRDNSTSDSEENSAVRDCDNQSVGDTDNQVSSLGSSVQNLSEMTQPVTAKPADAEPSREPSLTKNNSESSDDTHKNIAQFDIDQRQEFLQETDLEVESGIEVLEDTIDAFGDVNQLLPEISRDTPTEPLPADMPYVSPSNFGLPPSNSNLFKTGSMEKKHLFNFLIYFLTIFLLLNYILLPNANVWNGFLLGIWFIYFTSSLKDWIMDNYFSDCEPGKAKFFQLKYNPTLTGPYTIPSVKEYKPMKKFEGWLNHYRFREYNPSTYHINKTTTAFVKLEGCNLRISYTRTKIAKRALWDEKIENVTFYQHRLYSLTGARIILLPKGLVNRRQWSKKYPICIILSDKEKIQVLERENSNSEKKLTESSDKKNNKELPQETESTETNTSPEKKKKFVWRRREKSVTHSENDGGKEGLRHRLVRKMHRDKKTDSASTVGEPETQTLEKNVQEEVPTDAEEGATKTVISIKDDDEDIDDSEISRVKELLDDTELESEVDGAVEGEWSIHVKEARDARLFLFTRTGRDKHEWFRRLITAVTEANTSAESSAVDDKPADDLAPETKDSVDGSACKLSEKEAVAFSKVTYKSNETISEGVTISTAPPSPSPQAPPSIFESYEKTFWPYLLKILQSHDVVTRQTSDVGVMCQLDPSPRDRAHKRRKKQSESSAPECECRTLPAEVSWVNAMTARLMFDVCRDPRTIARLQSRIQRKLHTLKMPSFMSPLTVTQLQLAGCPLVRSVRVAAADARGLWLHADITYTGGAGITVLTQINLLKLKEKNITLEDHLLSAEETVIENEVNVSPVKTSPTDFQLRKRKPAIYDSEVEDSAESSSDDERPPPQPVDSAENVLMAESGSTSFEGTSGKKKFLRMVDKIATNKYFQQVTDYKYVKRAMEGLSNTDIKLQLELNGLEGTLAINVPPPPHDRIWLGFCTNPQLALKARPAVGARTLRFAHISNWIEQKLTKEFEKVLVLPNMEDIIVDIMTPTPIEYE